MRSLWGEVGVLFAGVGFGHGVLGGVRILVEEGWFAIGMERMRL